MLTSKLLRRSNAPDERPAKPVRSNRMLDREAQASEDTLLDTLRLAQARHSRRLSGSLVSGLIVPVNAGPGYTSRTEMPPAMCLLKSLSSSAGTHSS